MSKGITKRSRFKRLFWSCMFTIIACTLMLGGMLLNPLPAQAIPTYAPYPLSMTAHVNQPFSYQFSLTGTPYCSNPSYVWQIWQPPSWLTIDANTGRVYGTPTAASSGTFQVRVKDIGTGGCTCPCYIKDSQTTSTNWTPVITITVLPSSTPPTYAPYPLSMTACVGQPFSYQFSLTGTPYCSSSSTLHWQIWQPPAWLTIDANTGQVYGTPNTPSTEDFQVRCYETGTGGCNCPCYIKDFQTTSTNWTPPITITAQSCGGSNSGGVIIITTPPPTPTSTNFNYSINIGSGLGTTVASVSVNGQVYASMTGGETKTFTGTIGQSYVVSVPDTVPGTSGTRFKVQGGASKTANENNNAVNFNYVPEYQVEFKTDPQGVAQLPGSNWYSAGTTVNSIAPELVTSAGEKKEYIFAQWNLPDGGKSLSRNLSFTLNGPGTYYAVYTYRSVTAPEVKGQDNTLMWIIILILVIISAAVVFFISRRRSTGLSASSAATIAPPSQPLSAAPDAFQTTTVAAIHSEKKTLTKTESIEKPNFCPKCGTPVEQAAEFCKKCGNKLG